MIAAVAITVSAKWGVSDLRQVLVAARQLYGLWALALLLTSMLLGPLTSVLPWMPFKPSLIYGRRAIGVSALIFGGLHLAAYVWSVLRRNWRELYTPGILWVTGLILGMFVFADMLALGLTSRDAAVRSMGGRKWKRLHRTVYVVLGLTLLHAICVGADFGLNRAPDVKGEADFGSLIAFLSLSAGWLVIVLLRRRGWRWTPRFQTASKSSS
ncbi:MAG TPA: ferric reductase-like transmembrane domain-containing protein [Tepidisphaeraceae bacterium]|nr:ferric reductase-like transmembrane domain-containing protein [Tepidisphaeraceae bacterium]